MKYSQEQLTLLRARWQQPLLSPESAAPVMIDNAATFAELLAFGMAKIQALLESHRAAPSPTDVALSRSVARKIWQEECDLLFTGLLSALKQYGLKELYPIETPRYQIRDSGDLRGAPLKKSLFDGAFLENVHFEGADLTDASFIAARCFESHFEAARCDRVNFSDAECHFAVFSSAQCEHAHFDRADCTMVRFDHTVLRHASFHETICFAATFNQALLAKAAIAGMSINHLTRFGRPGEMAEAEASRTAQRRKEGEEEDWYIVDLFPAWLRAAQVNNQIRLLLKSHGYFLEADEYQYLEMVCQRHLLQQSRLKNFLEWLFKDLMFGYGLKWKRPLFTVLTIILIWACGFALHFHLNALHDLLTSIGYGLYYSVIAFTTLGFGSAPDLDGLWPKLLLSSEALLGTILMPLFLLAYARKILQD